MSLQVVLRWNIPKQPWSRLATKLVVTAHVGPWPAMWKRAYVLRFPRWPWFYVDRAPQIGADRDAALTE